MDPSHTTFLRKGPCCLLLRPVTRKISSLVSAPQCRGGHRHWQVGRMPVSDLIPDLRSKGVKDHTFLKIRKAKIVPSTSIMSIIVDPDF